MIKSCQICNKSFYATPFNVKKGFGKFCSRECCSKTRIGIKLSEIARKNMSLARIGMKLSEQHKLRISEGCKQRKERDGYINSPETKKKLSLSLKGKKHYWIADEKHPMWRGDRVKYIGLHMWIARKLGKPDTCEHCGRSNLSGRFIQWANKSREYKRELSDWLRLCVPCHKSYDQNKLELI